MNRIRGGGVVAAGLVLAATAALAQDGPAARPAFGADGTVRVPAFELPVSDYVSAEARAMQQARARMGTPFPQQQDAGIATRRAQITQMLAGQVASMHKRYPVDVAESTIGGVPVRVFTPKGGQFDPARVLINLHGGAFSVCWESCSQLESIPVAALGGYKVVSVNYRMAPEAAHPAGVEDAAAVYRQLLNTYDPGKVGVFGCSAGGALTAQLAAWLPMQKLPQPGAIGIFGAGADRFSRGDSAWIAASIDGSFPAPRRDGSDTDITGGYFAKAERNDPVIAPVMHREVLARFPPTLLVTGTRAMDMSPAIVTHSRLLAAGADSALVVGEGMGHCYIYMADLPEARDAYAVIVDHFRKHLD